MNGEVINPWITLQQQRNGVTVQRKYSGESHRINPITNKVIYCTIYYYEQELYPNGQPIKMIEKCYHLENLPEDLTETYRCEPKLVLDEFIENLGQDFIINPVRETLLGLESLPIDAPDNDPLHRDTRERLPLIL